MLTGADWEELRSLARSNVEGDRQRHISSLRLGPIDAAALEAADAWLGRERVAAWDWRALTKRSKDNRFEVAVWHEARLCGLGFGPVEGVIGMGRACVEYIEGDPRPHPLRGQIIPLVLVTAEELARIVGLPEVRLLGPLPALVPHYVSFGYELMAGRPGISYLSKRINQS